MWSIGGFWHTARLAKPGSVGVRGQLREVRIKMNEQEATELS